MSLSMATITLVWFLHAATPPARPPITGIAKVGITSTQAESTRRFYSGVLGLRAGGGCDRGHDGCYLINDHQRIEVFQAPGTRPWNPLTELAFATPDVVGMRAYLLAHRVRGVGALAADEAGHPRFSLMDPAGMSLAFVEQPAPGSPARASANEQVSTRLLHVGFAVFDRKAADAFYRGVLGFRMYWQGGLKETDTDWVQLQVPDGSDWIEYTLNADPESGFGQLSLSNHLALGVSSLKPAVARLRARGLKSDGQPEVGRDGKWHFDTVDPDDIRVELMEFAPVRTPCCHPYEAPHPKE